MPREGWHTLAGVVFFGTFAGYRAVHYRPGPLWIAELGLGLALTLVYLVRRPAVAVAHGFWASSLPYLGLVLPLALLDMPVHHPTPVPPWVLGLVVVGMTLDLGGLLSLWGSFAVGIELRTVVDGGLYRFIRHPMYLGQVLYTAAGIWFHASGWGIALGLAFAAVQAARAWLEERHLARWSPQYLQYQARTWPRRG